MTSPSNVRGYARELIAPAVRNLRIRFRRLWVRVALHRMSRNDLRDRLEFAYLVTDPWKLDSAKEHARFSATNEHIQRAFGAELESILEIGSGEGLQSRYLATLCRQLTGIEVSSRAVERAKVAVPTASFLAGDLLAQPWAGERHRFDVVVACEVLYYLPDVPAALAAMRRLARRGCLVTYFVDEEERVGAFVRAVPGAQFAEIQAEGQTWIVAWWTT